MSTPRRLKVSGTRPLDPRELFAPPTIGARAARVYLSMSESLHETILDLIPAGADKIVLECQQFAYIAWRAAQAETAPPETMA